MRTLTVEQVRARCSAYGDLSRGLFKEGGVCYIIVLLCTDADVSVPFSSQTATTSPLGLFHIVTEPRRGMLQQNMTKYFSRADGQDSVSTHVMANWKDVHTPDPELRASLLQHFEQQGVGE